MIEGLEFFFFFGSKWIKLIKKIENLWGLFKKRKECERKEWWRAVVRLSDGGSDRA